MAENLAETIARLRLLKTNGPECDYPQFKEEFIHSADALLEAAEYGDRCGKFFREHSERAKLLLIENCNKCEMVCPMEVATCEHVIAAAEAYGLWPNQSQAENC